jgi:carbonic anhydrase
LPTSETGSNEEAAVEYAIKALKVRHIILCGHTDCGAIQTVLKKPSGSRTLPALSRWLRHAESIVPMLQGRTFSSAEQKQEEAVRANIRLQLSNLQKYPVVKAALRQGQIDLHGWVYHLENGTVECLEPHSNKFIPLDSFLHLQNKPA